MVPRYLIFSLLIAASIASAQPPPPPKSGTPAEAKPRLFVAQRTIDLGKVLEGDKVPLSWTLENQGTADLVIDQTRASCGCTIVKLGDEEKIIAPGKSLELKAEFDSNRRFGSQSKQVAVESNDPAEPRLTLEFKAEVEKAYELSPTVLNLRSVRRGVPSETMMTITPEGGRKQVESVRVEFKDHTPLLVKTEPIKSKTGDGQRVQFTVSEEAALGSIITDATVTIMVDGLERVTEVQVRGEVVSELSCTPKVVDATRQSVVRGQRLAPVNLESTNDLPFELLSAKAGAFLDVSAEPAKGRAPGARYTVVASIRDDAPDGPFGTTIEVRTSLPDQPVVEIPVFGIVSPRVEVEPPVALLKADGTPKGGKRRIKLQVAPSETLKINAVKCDNPAVSIAIDPESAARYKHLRYLNLELTGKLPSGTHQATITVETAVAGAAKLSIPLIIEVPG